MSNRIQIRRDSTINWQTLNPILADGEPGLNIDNNLVKYGDGETPWNGLIYNGLQGTQGVQGPAGSGGGGGGAQGIQGINGSQGVQGLQGPSNGPEGSQGIQGTEGSQGVQGVEGSQGVQGVEGSQGVQGIDGGQGVQGVEGSQGVQGVEGFQGLETQGIQGVQGVQGLQGVQGVQGVQGLQGVQGPSPTVAYGSSIRAASVTSAGTSTVTIDFSQDGIILIKDPTNSPTITFTNITAGKRCSVILQNTTTDSIIVNTGVAADQAVSGSNSVLNRGRQTTFLEYVCYSNVSTGVFLIVDPY